MEIIKFVVTFTCRFYTKQKAGQKDISLCVHVVVFVCLGMEATLSPSCEIPNPDITTNPQLGFYQVIYIVISCLRIFCCGMKPRHEIAI